ncbi:MAG TPA: beta-galactosidase [Patescibacteria group bacterium]|nr:beta-galactosidase [Patescibacteria group bacterium]
MNQKPNYSENPKEGQSFSWEDDRFLLGDEPIQFFSGEMHYQRIPRKYWRHRLKMAKAMGLNAVAIYMFWNAHEPRPGEFNFKGRNDVRKFVEIAAEEGLFIILRPGPYCCAEWDFGGLPPFLLKDPNMRVRCMYPPYLEAVKRYIKRWTKELKDLQCTQGGPIIMCQVENEYGSYGSDKKYLRFIKDLLVDCGFEVPFFTCDGPADHYLISGTLPEILAGVNFGSNPQNAFKQLEKHRKNIPHMCFEYYPGWFTHWGKRKSHSTNVVRRKQIKSELKWMIEHNKSWNLYMFHGGTNFGFTAGANLFDKYKPDITSYDYSSPVSESGTPTKQFFEYRDLLKGYQTDPKKLPDIPPTPKKIETDVISFDKSASLWENLPDPIKTPQVHSMEYYNLNNGLILYRKQVHRANCGRKVIIKDVHDYAHIFLNGERIGTYFRPDHHDGRVKFTLPKFDEKAARLDILVESMGRVNYGSHILDRKGITEFVSYDNAHTLMNWEIYPIDLNSSFFNTLEYKGTQNGPPAFYKSEIDLDGVGDTFLDTRPWKKGMVWVNGHNLGRYWEIGPQHTLYLPGPWLKKGKNEIIMMELEGFQSYWALRKIYKKRWDLDEWKAQIKNRKIPLLKGLDYPVL